MTEKQLAQSRIPKRDYNKEFIKPNRSFSPETKPLKELKAMSDGKFDKLMNGCIRKREKFDFISKERHITEKWREHNIRYRQMAKAIERGVTKLILQDGFNEIRDKVRKDQAYLHHQKVARKWVLWRYRKATQQAFFGHWRYIVFGQELKDLAVLRRTEKEEIHEHSLFLQRMKTVHSILSNERSYVKAMRTMWDTWHNYAFEMAVKRRQTAEYAEMFNCYKLKRALYKLKQRSDLA